jgi:hypothetical protein
MIQMKSRNDDCGAIEGVVVLVGAGTGVVGGRVVIDLDVKERVHGDHLQLILFVHSSTWGRM